MKALSHEILVAEGTDGVKVGAVIAMIQGEDEEAAKPSVAAKNRTAHRKNRSSVEAQSRHRIEAHRRMGLLRPMLEADGKRKAAIAYKSQPARQTHRRRQRALICRPCYRHRTQGPHCQGGS